MRNPLTFFSKTGICKPLQKTKGKHIAKYRFFKTFLHGRCVTGLLDG